jgi:hypothetical protein
MKKKIFISLVLGWLGGIATAIFADSLVDDQVARLEAAGKAYQNGR